MGAEGKVLAKPLNRRRSKTGVIANSEQGILKEEVKQIACAFLPTSKFLVRYSLLRERSQLLGEETLQAPSHTPAARPHVRCG